MNRLVLQDRLTKLLGAPALVEPPKWEGQTVAIVKIIMSYNNLPTLTYTVFVDCDNEKQVQCLLQDLEQAGGI